MKPVAYPEGPSQVLVGVAMSFYYLYFLYPSSLSMMSKLTQQIVHTIEFDSRNGQIMIGILYNANSHSLFVWSNKLVYQLVIDKEETEIWKYLVEQKKYKEAVKFCAKHQLSVISEVKGLYGDHLYRKKETSRAAEAYAESSKSFEEVCLQLAESPPALQHYLSLKLKSLPADKLSQRTLLSTWLLELYLNEMNTLLMKEDDSDFKSAQKNLWTFLSLRKADLDEDTTYTLLQSHGRVEDWIYFAEMKDNFKNVMLHYINQQEFKKALSKLEFVDPSSQDEILYKYSPIFIKHEPTKTVDLLIQSAVKAQESNRNIELQKLLPALMNVEKGKRDQAIRFEKFCIEKLRIKDRALHNLYVFHLSERDESMLISYFKRQECSELDFDLDYALSVCKHNENIEAQIYLYTMMKMYSEAVLLALEHNRFELAKENARKTQKTDEDLSRKLWMQIVAHLINEGKFTEALEVMHGNTAIKMEDVLPLFDKEVSISDFKDEICKALEGYKETIWDLNEELTQSSESSSEVTKEIAQMKNRRIEIDGHTMCELCSRPLLKCAFFIYPCLHGYHKKCLISNLLAVYERKDEYLYNRLRELSRVLEGSPQSKARPKQLDLEDCTRQLDSLLGSSCFLCGHLFIESVRDEYLDDIQELRTWEFNDKG